MGINTLFRQGVDVRVKGGEMPQGTVQRLQIHVAEHAGVALLMRDFLDRRLCCGEILRVVRLVIGKHRGGMSVEQIRESLWVTEGIGVPGRARRRCERAR